jgi:hypothetical protein
MRNSTAGEIKHLGMSQDLFGHERKALTLLGASSWIRLARFDPPVHLKGPNREEPNRHHGDPVTDQAKY